MLVTAQLSRVWNSNEAVAPGWPEKIFFLRLVVTLGDL